MVQIQIKQTFPPTRSARSLHCAFACAACTAHLHAQQASWAMVHNARDGGENKKADGGAGPRLGVRDKIVPLASHITGSRGGRPGGGGPWRALCAPGGVGCGRGKRLTRDGARAPAPSRQPDTSARRPAAKLRRKRRPARLKHHETAG